MDQKAQGGNGDASPETPTTDYHCVTDQKDWQAFFEVASTVNHLALDVETSKSDPLIPLILLLLSFNLPKTGPLVSLVGV